MNGKVVSKLGSAPQGVLEKIPLGGKRNWLELAFTFILLSWNIMIIDGDCIDVGTTLRPHVGWSVINWRTGEVSWGKSGSPTQGLHSGFPLVILWNILCLVIQIYKFYIFSFNKPSPVSRLLKDSAKNSHKLKIILIL